MNNYLHKYLKYKTKYINYGGTSKSNTLEDTSEWDKLILTNNWNKISKYPEKLKDLKNKLSEFYYSPLDLANNSEFFRNIINLFKLNYKYFFYLRKYYDDTINFLDIVVNGEDYIINDEYIDIFFCVYAYIINYNMFNLILLHKDNLLYRPLYNKCILYLTDYYDNEFNYFLNTYNLEFLFIYNYLEDSNLSKTNPLDHFSVLQFLNKNISEIKKNPIIQNKPCIELEQELTETYESNEYYKDYINNLLHTPEFNEAILSIFNVIFTKHYNNNLKIITKGGTMYKILLGKLSLFWQSKLDSVSDLTDNFKNFILNNSDLDLEFIINDNNEILTLCNLIILFHNTIFYLLNKKDTFINLLNTFMKDSKRKLENGTGLIIFNREYTHQQKLLEIKDNLLNNIYIDNPFGIKLIRGKDKLTGNINLLILNYFIKSKKTVNREIYFPLLEINIKCSELIYNQTTDNLVNNFNYIENVHDIDYIIRDTVNMIFIQHPCLLWLKQKYIKNNYRLCFQVVYNDIINFFKYNQVIPKLQYNQDNYYIKTGPLLLSVIQLIQNILNLKYIYHLSDLLFLINYIKDELTSYKATIIDDYIMKGTFNFTTGNDINYIQNLFKQKSNNYPIFNEHFINDLIKHLKSILFYINIRVGITHLQSIDFQNEIFALYQIQSKIELNKIYEAYLKIDEKDRYYFFYLNEIFNSSDPTLYNKFNMNMDIDFKLNKFNLSFTSENLPGIYYIIFYFISFGFTLKVIDSYNFYIMNIIKSKEHYNKFVYDLISDIFGNEFKIETKKFKSIKKSYLNYLKINKKNIIENFTILNRVIPPVPIFPKSQFYTLTYMNHQHNIFMPHDNLDSYLKIIINRITKLFSIINNLHNLIKSLIYLYNDLLENNNILNSYNIAIDRLFKVDNIFITQYKSLKEIIAEDEANIIGYYNITLIKNILFKLNLITLNYQNSREFKIRKKYPIYFNEFIVDIYESIDDLMLNIIKIHFASYELCKYHYSDISINVNNSIITENDALIKTIGRSCILCKTLIEKIHDCIPESITLSLKSLDVSYASIDKNYNLFKDSELIIKRNDFIDESFKLLSESCSGSLINFDLILTINKPIEKLLSIISIHKNQDDIKIIDEYFEIEKIYYFIKNINISEFIDTCAKDTIIQYLLDNIKKINLILILIEQKKDLFKETNSYKLTYYSKILIKLKLIIICLNIFLDQINAIII